MILVFLVALTTQVLGDSSSCGVNCTLYYRHGNEQNCAKDFGDCGACLEGYEEVGTTKGTKRVKPCRKKDGCDSDDECDYNYHCYHRNCVACFNCLNYNRIKKSRCARGPVECGFCLSGFHEVPSSTDGKVTPCKQGTYAAYSSQNEAASMATVGTVSVISVTFLAVVIFAAFIYVVVKRKIVVNRDEENSSVREEIPIRDLPMTRCPPPTYSEANDFGSCEEFTTFVSGSKELVNEAIVFRNPTAPYYPSSSYVEDEGNEAELEDEPGEAQPEDDEATIPSSWTPNATSSPNENSNDLCTFTGLFPSSNSSETEEAPTGREINLEISNREINLDESQSSVQSANTQDSSESHRETRC